MSLAMCLFLQGLTGSDDDVLRACGQVSAVADCRHRPLIIARFRSTVLGSLSDPEGGQGERT